jgi:23S rRNA pseudouridine2605 synthase
MSSSPRARRTSSDLRPPPRPPEQGVRLQKVLSAAGVASRRRAEELMRAGRVTVDGRPATTLGMRVDPERARIEVDGRRVEVRPDRVTLALNKPAGVVTTARDPQGRPTVLDLVAGAVPPGVRVFPVGRLDADTQGLLLLTNDGELAHRLAHPRYQVPRAYLAEVRGLAPDAVCRRLERGVLVDDGPARARRARIVARGRDRTQIELVMTEGRKREVRRMLDAVGFPVTRLVRTAVGPVRLGRLRAGQARRLTPVEEGELRRLVGL